MGELQRQTEDQRLALHDAQYGFVESRREQVRLPEELFMKESSPKYSNPKHARETIQQLPSQLHQMQEQINSVSSSGYFQDVEPNYIGKLSYAATKHCRLTHGINLDYRKTFWWNQLSRFESPRDHPQIIQLDEVQRNREAVPEAERTKTIHTFEDRLNHLQEGRRLWVR